MRKGAIDGVVELSCSFDSEAELVHVDSDSMHMESPAWSHVYIYICVQYLSGVPGLYLGLEPLVVLMTMAASDTTTVVGVFTT